MGMKSPQFIKISITSLGCATPYHLMIDIVGRTEANYSKMDYAPLINVTS